MMRITHVVAMAALVVGPPVLGAQATSPPLLTRTYLLHNLRPGDAVQLIGPYVDAQGGGVYAAKGAASKAISVRGSARNLASVDSVLRVLDAPAAAVMLRFELIAPADTPSSDPTLQDLQVALTGAMGFRGVRLIARGAVAVGPWADFAVTMSGDGGRFLVSGDVTRIATATESTIGLRVGLTAADAIPNDSTAATTNMIRAIMPGNKIVQTSITMPLGRTVVLGSGTRDVSGNTVILVVAPTLLP